MKNILARQMTVVIMFVVVLSTGKAVMAQSPQGIPYQAVARNSSGAILASQTIRVRFSVHDSVAGGTIVYRETFTPTTTAQGLFSANVGTGTETSGTFASITWGHNAKFMQVEMDPTGGTSYIDMGTQQMMSVPYALYSNNGMPAGTSMGDMLYWNGSSWLKVPAGTDGQYLKMCGGVPSWGVCVPFLTTTGVSSISATYAVSSGSISTDGGSPILAKGICWSTSPNPTIALTTKSYDGSGQGSYSTSMSPLVPNTTYYLRAYATNSTGTAYGNQLSFTTSDTGTHTIGQAYRGGVIAYILQAGDPGYDPYVQHGLIAAPYDQTGMPPWGCNGTFLSLSGAIGQGSANTSAIIASCGTNTAAYLCDTLTLGGYSDWYLPSSSEVYKLYLNKALIGGFLNGGYWSSTDFAAAWANLLDFSSGEWFSGGKSSGSYVRAVRTF